MARRKKKDNLVSVLIEVPWQVNIGLGCAAYVIFRWVLPGVLAGNVLRPMLTPFFSLFAPVSSFFFVVTALLAFFKEKAKQKDLQNVAMRRAPIAPLASPNQASIITSETNDVAIVQNTISTIPAPADTVHTTWTLEALCTLEWKRFELVCAKYYELLGFKADTLRCGPDGGIDIKLFKTDTTKPIAIVQCKAWNSNDVGVKELRELLGVMTHEKVNRGIFITTSGYTKDATAFGASSPIQMLNGATFLAKIQELTNEGQKALLDFAFDGDYKTPTCPSCGIKMMKRASKRGSFFGCGNFPRCRRTFAV
jgi:restriction system protein